MMSKPSCSKSYFSYLRHCSCFVSLHLQRGSVAEWSASRTRNPEALGSRPPLTAGYNSGLNLLKHLIIC